MATYDQIEERKMDDRRDNAGENVLQEMTYQ
jgi:hypothetical protein